MRRWILIGLLGLGALASCSVKEDRSDAACWITVTAETSTSMSIWYGSQRILDNHPGSLVDHMVPRGTVDLVASNNDRFTVSEGEQMSGDDLGAPRACRAV